MRICDMYTCETNMGCCSLGEMFVGLEDPLHNTNDDKNGIYLPPTIIDSEIKLTIHHGIQTKLII